MKNLSSQLSIHQRSQKGMALVMTVIILALVTIMVLGYADLIRNETVSSSSHVERTRAQVFAEMGVDMVIGTLREHSGNSDRVWASQPGALIVPDPMAAGSNALRLSTQVPLHSGLPSSSMLSKLNTNDPFAPANLNISTLNDPDTHIVTDQRIDPDNPESDVVSLPLRWIYVRKDGSLDDDEEPDMSNAANPLVGRFAWWVDDESSKVNINTAWKRNPPSGGSAMTNPFSPSHVSNVNISNVFTSVGIGGTRALEMADQIHAHVTPDAPYNYSSVARFFNSIREMRELGDDFRTVVNATKFELTHYNHDPDTTFFNEPRIVLTTKEELAPRDADGELLRDAKGRPYFLDIKRTNATDMWLPSTQVDPEKLADTIDMLNDYLKRTDWPMAPGSSFQDKYYAGKANRLTQLSLNIINYVRSKESKGDTTTGGVVIPIRGTHPAGGRFNLAIDTTPTGNDAYLGISRTPRITEMGLWVSMDQSQGRYKLEIHSPKEFNLGIIDLRRLNLYLSSSYNSIRPDGTIGTPWERAITISEVVMHHPDAPQPMPGNPFLAPGGYAVITRIETLEKKNTRPTSVNLRFAIARNQRWDITPLGGAASCALDPAGVAEGSISSIEIDDPRVSAHANDWKPSKSGNTFGLINSNISLGTVPTNIRPQQDTDAGGTLSDASYYMPPVPGSEGNESGLVESPGELGYIHTGMESGAGAGVPWRTLRLQPNNYPNATVVPDWAFMDLFTVPISVPDRAMAIFGPHNGTAGRINLNSQAQPFGNPTLMGAANTLERRQSIAALLLGVQKNRAGEIISSGGATTIGSAENIAQNIYFQVLADNGKRYGYMSGYDSPGEVVEIKGVADGGEESEAVVRGIANLLSTRGGVYTVFSIGQTLQQTRSGDDLVITGEYRQQTMLERYNDTANSNQITVRRLSYTPITP